jgi:hypothetical protein
MKGPDFSVRAFFPPQIQPETVCILRIDTDSAKASNSSFLVSRRIENAKSPSPVVIYLIGEDHSARNMLR